MVNIWISFGNLFWILFVFIVIALLILGIDFIITNATNKISQYSEQSVEVTNTILQEAKAGAGTLQAVNQQINDFIKEFNEDAELLAQYLAPIKDKLCLYCPTQITPTPPNNWAISSAVCDYLINQKQILVCPTTTNPTSTTTLNTMNSIPQKAGVLLRYLGC